MCVAKIPLKLLDTTVLGIQMDGLVKTIECFRVLQSASECNYRSTVHFRPIVHLVLLQQFVTTAYARDVPHIL